MINFKIQLSQEITFLVYTSSKNGNVGAGSGNHNSVSLRSKVEVTVVMTYNIQPPVNGRNSNFWNIYSVLHFNGTIQYSRYGVLRMALDEDQINMMLTLVLLQSTK